MSELKVSPAPGWYSLPPIFPACAAEYPNAVLLETAKPDGQADRSLLFVDPCDELIAWAPGDLDELLRELDRRVAEGAFLAGYFSYECGHPFVGIPEVAGLAERPLAPSPAKKPIAWLGVFSAPIEFDHSTGQVRGSLPPVQMTPSPADPQPSIHVTGIEIHPDDYCARFERIQEYLHAGDTYQVNFTDRIGGTAACDPLAIYEYFLRQQPVPFAALIHRPGETVVSFSPELFFRTAGRRITVRPMKGTWERGRNLKEDRKAAHRLTHDEKNRAEHVMIVDLLRNDLGRICEFGSIQVESLFQAERYKTLFQMTSTISGTLREEVTPAAVLRTLFPSGSVTGAPKRRTMEIIREIERHPRGVYTGSIGYFGPDGKSCFNVAIRTLEFSGRDFRFGVGGGITAGSKPKQEYDECRLKAAFLTRPAPAFSLIETMRAEGSPASLLAGIECGIPLLDLHMKRLSESAEYFEIRYDAQGLIEEIEDVARQCGSAICRIRVELDAAGRWTISRTPLDRAPWRGRLLLSEERVSSRDVFRWHKTTNRQALDRQLARARAAGFDEALFLNERDALTECAISNLFLLIQGRWTTPALASGVLPGVYRQKLLNSLEPPVERELYLEDLRAAERIVVSNALRGVRPVSRIETSAGAVIWASPSDPIGALRPQAHAKAQN